MLAGALLAYLALGYAVPADRTGKIDLQSATDADFAQLTSNGASNKEPAWYAPGRRGRN